MGLEYDFVKVLDFGIVKVEKTEGTGLLKTAAPVRMGTPAYMAPETILGDPNVDSRVDVYALGCVAYYLLTGERVFTAPTQMKLLMQHVQEQPVRPSDRTEQAIPREIDDLVMACLHKNPAERPADANELFDRVPERIAESWNQRAARHWWESHLPDLARPLSGSFPALKVAGVLAAQ
jgi:serine/threonine-protein kinase